MTAFNWEQLIDIAEHLVEVAENDDSIETKEAYFRSAVNRSYYAAYKTSEDWLTFNGAGYSPAAGDASHINMINLLVQALTTKDKNAAMAVSRYMNSLKAQRKCADYENSDALQPWNKRRAQKMIEMSRRIHIKLKSV